MAREEVSTETVLPVGTVVRILQPTEEQKQRNGWKVGKDKTVGKVGVITAEYGKEPGKYTVRIPGTGTFGPGVWYYLPELVKKVPKFRYKQAERKAKSERDSKK